MSNKRRTLIVIALALLAVLCIACSLLGYMAYRVWKDTGWLNGGLLPDDRLTEQPQTDATPPGDELSPAPAGGGTLRLYGDLPPTLDPGVAQDATSAEYIVHLFSGLVTLDANLEVVPDLAERWDVGEDGRRYTFYLRPDATFASGKPITAQDVVASMERACSPALGSPVALTYLADIVGVAEFARGEAQHIAGLTAIDDHTVQIDIDAPKAYFLAKLTYPSAFVVDVAQIEEQGPSWMSAPNGSGPFVLEGISRARIVLVRNDRYYGKRPSVERVEYTLSGGLPITMYENDELDICPVPVSDIERVLDPENPLHTEYVVAPELSIQYLGLNVNTPPFDDLRVRQAFAHAIDKHKIADLVLREMAVPARGILPPAIPDYNEGLEGLAYDPERARELLASSSYASNMPDVVLSVSGTSGYMTAVEEAILDMLQENLGVTVTVEQVEWGYFLRDLNQQRYPFYSSGWIADYPDSENFLDLLFHSASSQNHTGYHNDQVDALLEQARVETDPARRTSLYREAERLIVEDVAWIPLTHGMNYTLVKPYVKGFTAGSAIRPWLIDIQLEG
jgi:oligopeptide transport system substrate-binding protein